MNRLEEIKAKLEAAHPYENSAASGLDLVEAVEAVGGMLVDRQKLWDAVCTETCLKGTYGIDHRAIADAIADAINTTFTEALQ